MTSAPGDTISPAQLLHYLPTYRVLICLHCRYAIQPGAVMRHLKEIHSIKRIARQVFIDHVSKIELSQPNDVIAPDETHFPVPLLPIQTGLACTFVSCTHLCVTRKRMKQHWRSVHHIIASEEGNFWISVPLQTFFRGNALRYFTNPAFVVSPPRASSSEGLASDRNFLIVSGNGPPNIGVPC
jgi:hypothetical protein